MIHLLRSDTARTHINAEVGLTTLTINTELSSARIQNLLMLAQSLSITNKEEEFQGFVVFHGDEPVIESCDMDTVTNDIAKACHRGSK